MNIVWLLDSVFRQRDVWMLCLVSSLFETRSEGRHCRQDACLLVLLEVCGHGSFSLLPCFCVVMNSLLLYEAAEIACFSMLESIDD